MTTDPFVVTRDRDATATIRGFAYQIDVTLERWLDLDGEAVLLLEAGEDIDLAARGCLSDDPEDRKRLLEQVKNLTANITLRSPASVEAIACFIEHRTNNPGADLRFRFTTTARAGSEKSSPFEQPAIDVWQELRTPEAEHDRPLKRDGIRAILATASRPSKLAKTTWDGLVALVESGSDSELDDVIERFEWATASPSWAGQQQAVRSRLVDRFGTDDAYDLLVSHVLQLLATTGLKRLEADDVERVAANADRADRQLAARVVAPLLSAMRREVGEPLRRVEIGVANINQRLDTLLGAGNQNQPLALAPAGRLEVRDSPPKFADRVVYRQSLVGELKSARANASWLALVGGVGTGKSSTVALVAAESEGWFPALWLRFRDASAELCAATLQHALRVVCEIPSDEATLRTVVLEDLPRLASGDALAEVLCTLHERLHEGTSIVSTSAHQLPRSVRRVLGTRCVENELRWFDEPEVQTLLAMHGCPGGEQQHLSAAVHRLSEGHPTLCVGMAEALARTGWNADVLGKSGGGFHAETKDDVFERLLRTTEDDEACRQLLWRAALVHGSISEARLSELAQVSPALDVADTCIHRAKGVWMRRDGDASWSVSPLLRLDAESRVGPTVARAVFLALGDSLLAEGTTTPVGVAQALNYFVRAEAWAKVGTYLLLVLRAVEVADLAIWQRYFVAISGALTSRVPHPELLSSERIRLLGPSAAEADWARVDAALNDAATPRWVLLYIAVRVGLGDRPMGLSRGLALATRVASELDPDRDVLPSQEDRNDAELDHDASSVLPDLLPMLWWQAGAAVVDAGGLLDWATAVLALPPDLLHTVMGHVRARLVVSGIVSALGASLWEHGSSAAPHESTRLMFAEVAELSFAAGCELLAAASIRAHTIFQSETMGERDEAIQHASRMVSRLSEAWPQFLVNEAIATQQLFAGRDAEARRIYASILPTVGLEIEVEVVDAFLRLACVSDPEAALNATERSLDLATQLSGHATILVRGGLERSVALLRVGRLHDALTQATDSLEQAIAAVRRGQGSEILRCMVGLGGHTLLFLDSVVRQGHPPTVDDRPFDTPQQGLFLNAPKEAAAWGTDAAVDRLEGQLVRAAVLLGDRQRALRLGRLVWSRAGTMSASDRSLTLPFVADSLAASAILDGRHHEALSTIHAGVLASGWERDASQTTATFADIAAVQIGLAGAVLSLLWSEAEDKGDRAAWGEEIRGATSLADPQRPGSVALWQGVESVVDLVTSSAGWKVIHYASTPDTLYPAKNLLASAADDADPRTTAVLQVLAFANLSGPLRAFPAMGEWIPGLALTAYWKRRLRVERFRFAAPGHVERVLNNAAANPSKSVRNVLEEVVHATNARRLLPQEALRWLDQDEA